ncbi:phage head spike fiber domain-containing protein [Roseomonas haemaphysalidis]|uniref:Uncharacterized protein n=1 Tax=Roseomonas haemaphysalidis TaxID=2768162 RepID=A0ABS3KTF8_9PROT|nr:hypothetical protein [Roseomonas haemaphysalidis]MBO1080742.1 hypothetical protein [Roseomonas haemaphysalidis]
MNHAFSLTQAAGNGGGAALRVLGAAYPGRLATTRGGSALVQDADGSFQPAAADTPRFSGAARRLLVEGTRSNAIRNPRAEGATSGTPGTMPANWSMATLGGVSASVAGVGTELGLPYVDLRYTGTPSASGYLVILPEPITTIAAAAGQVWTASVFLRLVAGSLAGIDTFRCRVQERLPAAGPATDSFVSPGAMPQRVSITRTLTESSVATIGFSILPAVVAGAAVDFTLRVSAPQVELAAFASSPVLPPPGTPAASTRAADLPLWAPPGGFGTQGTLVVRAVLPQIAPFGASQGLWQLDDGTDQNRLQLRNTSAGSAITGVVDVGGSTVATLSGGNMAVGQPFRAAFAWAPGDQALCLSGGTLQSAAAALPPGLARLLVGHASGQLNRAAHGEVELVEYRPSRVPNALLQALANAA